MGIFLSLDAIRMGWLLPHEKGFKLTNPLRVSFVTSLDFPPTYLSSISLLKLPRLVANPARWYLGV